MSERRVTLRNHRSASTTRHLSAWMGDDGTLHIDGHDLGFSSPTGDDEYEWFITYDAIHVPAVRELLAIGDEVDILDALQERWAGTNASVMERRLSESCISRQFHSV
jgi:hypothetical protein